MLFVKLFGLLTMLYLFAVIMMIRKEHMVIKWNTEDLLVIQTITLSVENIQIQILDKHILHICTLHRLQRFICASHEPKGHGKEKLTYEIH